MSNARLDTEVDINKSSFLTSENVYPSYQAHIAASFCIKARESTLGEKRACEEILNMDNEEVGTLIRSGDHPKFTVARLLDALIYIHGHTVSRDEMNAAQDRAAYRRRKNTKLKPGTEYKNCISREGTWLTEEEFIQDIVDNFNEKAGPREFNW